MRIDRFVAAVLVPLALIEIFVGHAVPGPRPVGVLIALALAATLAVRRQAPLAAGVAAMVLITLQGFAGDHGTSVAETIAWMCGLYAIAVSTERPRLHHRRRGAGGAQHRVAGLPAAAPA